EFFEKKQGEFKFKKAGPGYRLTDSGKTLGTASGPPPPSRGHQQASTSQPHRSGGPDENVAKAALARFEGKTSVNKPTTKQSTLNDILAEERQKINEEMKMKEELEERKRQQTVLKEELEKNPYKEFEESQLFTCDSLDIKTPVPFKEMLRQIKSSIYDNFADD